MSTEAARNIPKGLGKGISALLGDDDDAPITQHPVLSIVTNPEGPMQELALGLIRPGKFQPRRHFDDNDLRDLAESVRNHGVIQPILVRATDNGYYEIIAGERRWRAAKLANLAAIPAVIHQWGDQQALEAALIENIQRADLNPMEESEGYQRLLDEFGYTQEELARVVGKSRSHVTNMLRLLQLPESVRHLVEAGHLTMGHARALLTSDRAEELAQEVITRGLSVRQTERLASNKPLPSIGNTPTPPKQAKPKNLQQQATQHSKDADILALEETLSANIGLKVEIFDTGGQGDVMIRYETLSQLDEVLRRLGGVG